jgi:hypothetical protein
MNGETPKSKNLLVDLAKKKTADLASGKRSEVLSQHAFGRPSRRIENRIYTWRGGRNGQGKP